MHNVNGVKLIRNAIYISCHGIFLFFSSLIASNITYMYIVFKTKPRISSHVENCSIFLRIPIGHANFSQAIFTFTQKILFVNYHSYNILYETLIFIVI